MKLILGSSSPRRLELLAVLGLKPDDIRPPEIDESVAPRELPRIYVSRIARAKAAAIDIAEDEVLLAADTTVALGRRILGKPETAEEAREFLSMLSGRRHRVYSAVVVRSSASAGFRLVESQVKMKRLSSAEIESYIAGNEWQGKAGGYSIQGSAGAFIPWMSGSYTGIVGLPLAETAQLLQGAGLPVWSP